MVPTPSKLVSTLFFLALVAASATNIHVNRALNSKHRALAERLDFIPPSTFDYERREKPKQPPRRLSRRKTCKAPTSSGAAASVSAASSTTEAAGAIAATSKAVEAVSKPAGESTAVVTTKTIALKTPTTTQKAAPTTTTSTASKATSTSSSSTSSSGHKFTLTNKCSAPVHPEVVSTACGYSPRCAGAAASAELPAVGELGAGQTTVITVPDDFVGRIFAQDGSCGASGEDCTMLEFNLDADSFYTPNSYDISNIQGFTQSISLGADGCDTVTCTSADCSCENAYPIGDETGCGADLPVKACGAGNIGFTVVFCP